MKHDDINSESVQQEKPLRKLVKVKNKKHHENLSPDNEDSGKVLVFSKNSVRGKYDAKSKLTYNREEATSPIEWKEYHGEHSSEKKKITDSETVQYTARHEKLPDEHENSFRNNSTGINRPLVNTKKMMSVRKKNADVRFTEKRPDIPKQIPIPEDNFSSEPFVFDIQFSQPERKKSKPINTTVISEEIVVNKPVSQPVKNISHNVGMTETRNEKSSKPEIQGTPAREKTSAKAIKSKSTSKNKPWKDILVKIGAVTASIVIVGALILNMPIIKDSKTDKRISIIRMFKTWQPLVENEGELEPNTMKLNIDPERSLPDFSDGLDLPQLIEGQFSVLLLGFDEDVFNTDVIWVVQFDIGHAGINILQIPRDTFVPDYTTGYTGKINSVYSMGDPYILPPIQRVVNTIQDNFGIPIDAYVTTTCFDIVDMVDIIGGIPITIDNEIIYEADKIIPAGDIVLNGQQAEWFVRFRREWLQGDIGRMQNQRRFMAAAMQKLLSIVRDEGRLKLYSYMKQIYDNEYIYTDLSLENMSMLADFAATMTMESVQVNMIPGEDAEYYAEDGVKYDVYSVHKQEMIDMLNAYFRPYQRQMTEWDTEITELAEYHSHSIYDDTGATLEELQEATEPLRDPDKKPEWKE